LKVLLTGGAGFIGSHFAKYLLQNSGTDYSITVVDALTYAGNTKNLRELRDFPNYRFFHGDIRDPLLPDSLFKGLDIVVNFAAESHVDRSISSSKAFIETNILGTHNLLLKCIKHNVPRFLQISTDEVYGSIPSGSWDEESLLMPNSPYAASKASADLLVRSFQQTFGLHTNITRCSNNYGTHQFPEKFIPVIIRSIQSGMKVPIYGDGSNKRDWLSVLDHCRAIEMVMKWGIFGEIYNVGGGSELTNLELVQKILNHMDVDQSRLMFVEDRKGHDHRYSVNFTKIAKSLDFVPLHNLDDDLPGIISWYAENRDWWQVD
jgi:dTDP-glucose 4,6-dehydratase